jgi:isopentenyldiphosphate isomerase
VEKIKQKIKLLWSQKNMRRAAWVYGISIIIGGLGFLIFFNIHSSTAWYFITCPPGFGAGIALAFVHNGHRKPVTLKSASMTVGTTILFAVLVYFLSDGEIFPVIFGWLLSFAGSGVGLWFCRWENKRHSNSADTPDVEMIEIYDAEMNKIGEMEKVQAHMDNHWHKNAHVWVTDGKNVLVQLRSPHKRLFPNKWDISCAGHFGIGDSSLDCAKREWAEELGTPWSFGDVKHDLIMSWGMLNGHPLYEFVYFFFLKGDVDLEQVKRQESEVADVKWMDWAEFQKQIKTDEFCPYGDEYWRVVVDGLQKLID